MVPSALCLNCAIMCDSVSFLLLLNELSPKIKTEAPQKLFVKEMDLSKVRTSSEAMFFSEESTVDPKSANLESGFYFY